MKTKTFSRLIVMVLCAVILVASIGLYAASEEDKQKCVNFCSDKYWYSAKLYEACYDGCVFGSDL